MLLVVVILILPNLESSHPTVICTVLCMLDLGSTYAVQLKNIRKRGISGKFSGFESVSVRCENLVSKILVLVPNSSVDNLCQVSKEALIGEAWEI